MRSGCVFVVAAIAALLILPSAGSEASHSAACATTPRAPHPPTPYLAHLSHLWWLKNRVWMGVAGAFYGGGFKALPKGQKIGWYRDRRGSVRLYAKRLDGPPATFKADVPQGYGTIGFQASGLTFGAPGCWALTAMVGNQPSRFVVRVAPAPSG